MRDIKLRIGATLRCISLCSLACVGLGVLVILYSAAHQPNAFDRPLAQVSLNDLTSSASANLLIGIAMVLDVLIVWKCIRKAFQYNEEAFEAWWNNKVLVIAVIVLVVGWATRLLNRV